MEAWTTLVGLLHRLLRDSTLVPCHCRQDREKASICGRSYRRSDSLQWHSLLLQRRYYDRPFLHRGDLCLVLVSCGLCVLDGDAPSAEAGLYMRCFLQL